MGGSDRFGGISVRTETLRVERVVCRLAREVAVSLWHEAPEGVREVVGLTIDVLDPSWDVFDGSALASATLLVWAYCLSDGRPVRALSWEEDLRTLIEDVSLRRGMSVEGRFSVGCQSAWIAASVAGTAGVGRSACGDDGSEHGCDAREADEWRAPRDPDGVRRTVAGPGRICVTATVVIDALVLETVVLSVITAIEAGERRSGDQSADAAPSELATETEGATGTNSAAEATESKPEMDATTSALEVGAARSAAEMEAVGATAEMEATEAAEATERPGSAHAPVRGESARQGPGAARAALGALISPLREAATTFMRYLGRPRLRLPGTRRARHG